MLPEFALRLDTQARAFRQLEHAADTAHARLDKAQIGIEDRVLVLVVGHIGQARRNVQACRVENADADGRVRATFEIVWLSGWAPHPDQQQPLKPGSAKARLADALDAEEISAGEKPGGR